jgi:hypothetical protein
MKMKYLLLLALAACGIPKEKPPTVPPVTTTPPEAPKPKGTIREILIEHIPGGENSTCFTWDQNPEPDVNQYNLYISTDGATWGTPVVTDTLKACSASLTQGEQYYAMVTATNTSGLESLPSETLPFRVAYIISDIDFKSTQLVGGEMQMSIEGPEHLMVANEAIVQWSEDLVNWIDIPVRWEFLDGVHTCTIATIDASRAFYRMGFKW